MKIKNIAVAAELEVEFGAGLNLLTGETGTGKSLLVDALELLRGERASGDLIRTGEDHAVVEALLEGPGIARSLDAHGVPSDGDAAIVRRELSAGGKGRATLNGALVPVSVLREVVAPLIEIHGQHEERGLLDPETHGQILDKHGRLAGLASTVAEAYGRLRQIDSETQALTRDRREQRSRRETIEFQVREIEAARLVPDEEDSLRGEKALVANADRLASLSGEAYAALYEDEHAVLARLAQVHKRVEQLASIDPRFNPFLEARQRVRADLEDLALFLRDYRETIQVKPGRLDAIEERLALLERLKKKYGASAGEVLAFAERGRADLETLTSPEERLLALEVERSLAASRYVEAAKQLSVKRADAARTLERKMESEFHHLAMDNARFSVRFEPAPARPEDEATWTAHGIENLEFLLSPNPGEELRPLARIASGGELSRILLALESVSAGESDVRTLVFDEVDVGIGGGVAEVVGRKLRHLAARHQVLCVTHLPQIAALADTHCAVRKRVVRGRTLTEIEPLQGEARVEELARMLAGETVTESARKHAREMVKQALRP